MVLASVPELERLQRHDTAGVLGFDWGIDPASPQRVREAQAGIGAPSPSARSRCARRHDVEQKSIYHFFTHNAWTLVDMPE